MDFYAQGQAEALNTYFAKDAGFRDGMDRLKADFRRAAVIGQMGLATVGGVGGLQAVQHTPPGATKTQLAANALAGGVGGIGGTAAGLVRGGLEGVKPGFDQGVSVGKGLVQPAARARMAEKAFPR